MYQNSAEQTTNAATKYLATVPQDGSKPYLLFLHYECTHDPYIKHAQWDYGDSDIDKYDSATNYCDEQVGRVLDALDARGDKDKTAVFVYSDHGELFGEHGFTRHGNTLYEPDVRALLLAKVPGEPRRGRSTRRWSSATSRRRSTSSPGSRRTGNARSGTSCRT